MIEIDDVYYAAKTIQRVGKIYDTQRAGRYEFRVYFDRDHKMVEGTDREELTKVRQNILDKIGVR